MRQIDENIKELIISILNCQETDDLYIFGSYGIKYFTEDSDIDIVKKYEDINYYRDLYDSWFAYKNENSDFTFEQWCEKNNKKISWISAYYYK